MATNQQLFARRKARNRFALRKLSNGRPRLSVHRSNKHLHVQIIDDATGVTLVAASTVDKDIRSKLKSTSNTAAAEAVGELIAKRAKEKKVSKVAFDRGGYLYHGRIKALADAARKAGLDF